MGDAAHAQSTAPRVGDVLMTRLARLLVRIFFSRIDLEGAANLPARGPAFLVGNHVNGLVDGLVLMAVLADQSVPVPAANTPVTAASGSH